MKTQSQDGQEIGDGCLASDLLGHSPEEWASIITIRMTAEWPQNPQDAEKIYTEIIRAAMDQERRRYWPNK